MMAMVTETFSSWYLQLLWLIIFFSTHHTIPSAQTVLLIYFKFHGGGRVGGGYWIQALNQALLSDKFDFNFLSISTQPSVVNNPTVWYLSLVLLSLCKCSSNVLALVSARSISRKWGKLFVIVNEGMVKVRQQGKNC